MLPPVSPLAAAQQWPAIDIAGLTRMPNLHCQPRPLAARHGADLLRRALARKAEAAELGAHRAGRRALHHAGHMFERGVGDVEFWLSSYDGAYSNDVFADAKKSREVRAGKLGVIGGIQPKVFLDQLEAGNANGFNSRPLFVHLPRTRRVLVEGDENTKKLNDVLGDLYLAALQDGNNAYVLSAGAEQLFINLFDQQEDLSLQAGSEEVEALWAKGPGQVLRVTAAIHFIRVATGQEELLERGLMQRATVVSERSLQLAANGVRPGRRPWLARRQ